MYDQGKSQYFRGLNTERNLLGSKLDASRGKIANFRRLALTTCKGHFIPASQSASVADAAVAIANCCHRHYPKP